MAIAWQRLPARSAKLPFNGEQVLLAIPNLIGANFGGDGRKVDPGFPFSLHLARWDEDQLRWATNETDEDCGGILWLDPITAACWAELNMPY